MDLVVLMTRRKTGQGVLKRDPVKVHGSQTPLHTHRVTVLCTGVAEVELHIWLWRRLLIGCSVRWH